VLCDDVAELRMLLRYALEELPGVRVLAEAGDGAEAVAAVTEHRPAVVVLDLAMPGVDGLQAIPEIRAVSPGTRILVFTGFVADGLQEQVLGLGADAYLEKGVSIDLVQEAVRRLAAGG
jgi:DNA-binding NarL/FixJ family response regulator